MSNQQNLKNLVDQANSLLRQTQTLLSGEDSRQLAGQIANVVSNVPRTWNDRNQTISQFVTDLVNKSLGLDGTLNLTLKNTDPSADATDFSNWMVTQAGAKNPGSGVTLDQVVNAALPENPETGVRASVSTTSMPTSHEATTYVPAVPTQTSSRTTRPNEGEIEVYQPSLSPLAEQIFWAAYDIINIKKRDQYRWDTQTNISLPGTNIQNVSVDLAALLEVLPEANNMVASSFPRNTGMGAGYAIQDASDSLRIVLNSIAHQNGSPTTRPVETRKPVFPVDGGSFKTNETVINEEKQIGDYPYYPSGKTHHGRDISAPEGTKIYSAFAGKVIDTGYSNAYGNFVKVESYYQGTKYYIIYGHMSKRIANLGDSFDAGQVIGYVGHTGNCDPPDYNHLHFEIRTKSNDISTAFDPMNLF